MLKEWVKLVLSGIGIDPMPIATAFRTSRLGLALTGRKVRELLENTAVRESFIRDSIAEFNPGLVEAKRPGAVRIALLWDRRDRLKWLEYANDDANCELMRVRVALLKPVWKHHMRDYLAASVDDRRMGEYALDTYFDPVHASSRAIYRQYCLDVVTFIKGHYDIDVFLIPKFNDDWTIELVTALNQIDLPLVIDDREGTNTKKRLETVPPRLKKLLDLDFDLMLTHNEAHRELFVASGFDPAKIIVNGEPQSDYWSRPDLWLTREKIDPRLRPDSLLILFFAFGPRNFMNFYYGDEKRNWTALGEDYHDVILRLLEKHGERIQIAYKLGGQTSRDRFRGYDAFARKAKRFIRNGALVELVGAVNSFDLLVNANIALGFQTSGLTEAMFLDKPIVCGAWGDLYEDIKDTMLPFHRTPALSFVGSKQQLWETIDSLVENPDSFELTAEIASARKEFRETYFHKPDGQVSRRALGYVKQLLWERAEARGTAARAQGENASVERTIA